LQAAIDAAGGLLGEVGEVEERVADALVAAVAAAEASGTTAIYDTRADLDAALGAHQDGDVAEVLVDETAGDARSKYRRVAGAWVRKVGLPTLDTTGLLAQHPRHV